MVKESASRNDMQSKERVILHFDYDCFYASCVEKKNPTLKSLPLAIQQKHIIVTCNYVARARGLRKLQSINEARRQCPDLVVVLGEDLTLFRDESKANFSFLKQFVWSGRIEKLGFDEVFMDVTEQIDFNMQLEEQKRESREGFFQLSKSDPTQGFHFDWSSIPGNIHPKSHNNEESLHKISRRLLLGAHLAWYLRGLLKSEQGLTCSAGICTSKLTAKLGGTVYKPDQQTLLIPDYVQDFLDIHEISKIPGIGSKTARSMRDAVKEKREKAARKYYDAKEDTGHFSDDDILDDAHDEADEEVEPSEDAFSNRQYADREDEKAKQLAKDDAWRTYYGDAEVKLKVVEARTILSKSNIETMFTNSVPNGTRVWNLLHGIDDTDVVPAADVPTQISIEDTFKAGSMTNLQAVETVMRRLCINLIRRMHTDLLMDPHTGEAVFALSGTEWSEDKFKSRWIAFPKTVRLSTRDRYTVKFGTRISRSATMPNTAFSLTMKPEDISDKLVRDTLVPLFKRMHSGRYDLALVNVAAVNMSDGEIGTSAGHIGEMFKRYNEVFPDGDWEKRKTATTEEASHGTRTSQNKQPLQQSPLDNAADKCDDSDDEGFLSEDEDLLRDKELHSTTPVIICKTCGAGMPSFAVEAHETYHRLENG